MGDKNKEINKTTVQGYGSPAPVGTAGGEAGPTRPSTSDCGSSGADLQALRSLPTTGEGTKGSPFQRSSILQRTPPTPRQMESQDTKKTHTSEQNEVEEVLYEGTSNMQNPKRKRFGTPEKAEVPIELQKLRSNMAKLEKHAKFLEDL